MSGDQDVVGDRRPRPWGKALTALVLVALLGAVGYLVWRTDEMAEQTATLATKVADVEQDLEAANLEVGNLQEALEDTNESVTSVGEKVEEQADKALDSQAVTKAALHSVVTVLCEENLGSGFVIDVEDLPEGYRSAVITNHHVVEPCTDPAAPQVQVATGDTIADAHLQSWDAVNDLALVYIDRELPALQTAKSPEVGDQVVAIGSPYGLDGTVTTGVISNIYDDAFQTDAAIGPGNSGGPLLDRHGDVLGVTTAMIDTSQGTNFAVRMRMRCEQLVRCD